MKAKDKWQKDALNEFQEIVKKAEKRFYLLRLFLTGCTPNSAVAVEGIKKFREQNLSGRYEPEVVGLYQPPDRRLVGDLTKTERVLHALSIKS